jgi:site-specific recombinase XerD
MSVPTKLCLFKRSNGFYYIVYPEDGRRRWKSTGTHHKVEALKVLSDLKALLRARPATPLLSEFRKDFIAFATSNHAAATRDLFALSLKTLQKVCGDQLLSNYQLRHVDMYKTHRVASVSPVSVNAELRALRSAFGYAMRWGLLDDNPLRGLTLLRVPASAPAYLTTEAFGQLVSAIGQGWLKEIVVFSVMTGLRRAEVVSLRWQDVDPERGMLLVQSYGNFRTKSDKVRAVPLTDEAAAILKKKHDRDASARVFMKDGEKIAEDYLTKAFKSAVKKAGLDSRLHFHSLRHTFASWLVQNGAPLYEVQLLLGHSNIAVTQVYSHLQPEQLHRTVRSLSPIVRGLPGWNYPLVDDG